MSLGPETSFFILGATGYIGGAYFYLLLSTSGHDLALNLHYLYRFFHRRRRHRLPKSLPLRRLHSLQPLRLQSPRPRETRLESSRLERRSTPGSLPHR